MDIDARAAASRTRRWLSISLGAVAVAALAGCGSGHTAEKAAAGLKPAAISPSPSATSQRAAPATSAAASRAPSTAPSSASASASAAPSASAGVAGRSAGCVTSGAKAGCGPYRYPQIQGATQQPTVGQDVWNPVSGWHQTLSAAGPGNWSVTANMPAGNTAVLSYPNTGAAYGEQPLSKFKSIYSSFSENMNARAGTSAWATYDLWFNNWGIEVMIQHDFAGNGPCSFVATQSFGGSGGVPVRTWGLCKYGTELIWKLTRGNEQSGSVDILAMVRWLERHGDMPSGSTITDLSYGFEICSTGGQSETFRVSSFSISAS